MNELDTQHKIKLCYQVKHVHLKRKMVKNSIMIQIKHIYFSLVQLIQIYQFIICIMVKENRFQHSLVQQSHIPATNRPATSIHGEMPIKYIKQPPICGKLATRRTSFVLRDLSDHLKQLTESSINRLITRVKVKVKQMIYIAVLCNSRITAEPLYNTPLFIGSYAAANNTALLA